MGLKAEECAKGWDKACASGSQRYAKKAQHRKQRRRMKNPDYEPSYNRYDGWVL